MGRSSKRLRFSNGRGDTLAGILDLPEGEPLFFGLFAPCFTCPKEQHGAFKICRAFAQAGAAMLRFDVTGTGESTGSLAETNFTTRILDMIAASRALEQEFQAPKILLGHSISGTAALSAVKYLPHIQAFATIGSPRDPASIIEKFKRKQQIHDVENGVEVDVLGRKVFFKKDFVNDMLKQTVVEDTAKNDRKLFIFHAPHDDIVSFDNARAIYDRAKGDRELVPLDEEATHLFENRSDDAVFIAQTLMDWARAHLR